MDISQIDETLLAREKAYEELLAKAQRTPFGFGSQDCCTFPAKVIEARTGRNPLGTLSWSSALEAERLLKSMGGLKAAVTACLGEPVAPLLARVGDPVMVMDGDREMLTVCHGTVLLAPGRDGLVPLPLDRGICAWRVE